MFRVHSNKTGQFCYGLYTLEEARNYARSLTAHYYHKAHSAFVVSVLSPDDLTGKNYEKYDNGVLAESYHA